MISKPVTRPCMQCKTAYPQTLIGNSCPSCEVTNWKYQGLVIPLGVMIGTIVALYSIFSVFNKF